jgi:hypothetical protein
MFFFINYPAKTIYDLYLQRLINCRCFLAPFFMVKYPAYDKSNVVDNLLITSPPCLNFVSRIVSLRDEKLRRSFILLTESSQERELIGYKLLISNNLRFMSYAVCC